MIHSPLVTSQTFVGSGNTGKITVSATEGNISLSDNGQLFTATRGTGAGGSIDITANNLQLSAASRITDDNLGPSKPGGLTVTLSGNLSLRDESFILPVSRSLSGSPAADFNITAKDILVTGNSGLSSETFRSGQGGDFDIFTDTLRLTEGGQIRSGSTIQPIPPAIAKEIPTGSGGVISIQGRNSSAQSVIIDGPGSGIFTDAQGIGPGGNIHVSAQSVTVQNAGSVSVQAPVLLLALQGGTFLSTRDNLFHYQTAAPSLPAALALPTLGNISINAGAQFLSKMALSRPRPQGSGGNISSKPRIPFDSSTANSAPPSKGDLTHRAATLLSIRPWSRCRTARCLRKPCKARGAISASLRGRSWRIRRASSAPPRSSG